MAKTDFSVVLDDIEAPKVADAASIFAKGAQQDHANAMRQIQQEGQQQAQTLKGLEFLGTAVGEVGKKVLTGQAEDEINQVLGEFATGDQQAEAAINANNQQLADKLLASAESDDFMGTQTVRHFTDEARRFAEAERQGVMSRQEAVARIGSVVKKYSAMVPGWAGEFRKKAAELTGISNIDTYGIHKALTEKSLRERAAEKQMEIDMQLRKEAASALGLPSMDALTNDAMEFYRSFKTTQMQAQQLEALKKGKDLQQEQVDQVNQGLIATKVGQALSGMNTRLTQVYAAQLAADGPLKAEEATRLGSNVAAQIQMVKADLVTGINAMTVGKNALSRKAAATEIENISKIMDDYSEFVKSAEGMNWWKQKVKDSKGNVEHLWNSFQLEHPNVMLWKELGVARDYVTAWDALQGNGDEFERRFGKVARQTMERIQKTGMGAYSEMYRRVATGKTSIGEEHDPDHKQMAYNEILSGLEKLAEAGGVLKDNQKNTVANTADDWLENVNVTNPTDLLKFSRLMTSPKGVEMFKQLDPMQRAKALSPLFNRLGTQVLPNTVKDVKQRVEEFNNLNVNKQFGHKLEVVLDPWSERLSVNVVPGPRQPKFRDSPTGAAMMGQPYVPPLTDPATREAYNTLKQRVEILNAVPRAIVQMTPLVNSESKPVLAGMLRELDAGIRTDRQVDIVASVLPKPTETKTETVDVPRNPQTPTVVDDTVLAALGHAESGNNPDAVGDSGKAVGEFQMWEGAMEDAGFTPADRKDPVKSKQAAKVYLEMQLKMFDGDMTKAIAAWNMGPGRFRQHLREHGDAWQEKLPQATKTLLKRFNSKLEGS